MGRICAKIRCCMMTFLFANTGIQGIPLPYSPQDDNMIAGILLLCFFISAFSLAHSRKYLLQQLKWFVFHRERISSFSSSTTADVRYLMLLLVQTCILSGIYLFNFSCDMFTTLPYVKPIAFTLGIYISACLAYFVVKWLLYSFLGWIFFDKNRTGVWLESYSSLSYLLGFVLFPIVLLLVYFDLELNTLVIIGLFLLAIAKILMFYKWIKLFSNALSDFLLLILYFCALEIAPCILFYSGMIKFNDLLTINI